MLASPFFLFPSGGTLTQILQSMRLPLLTALFLPFVKKSMAEISRPLPTPSLCQSEGHPGRGAPRATALFAHSVAGSVPQEARVTPYNHLLPRVLRKTAREALSRAKVMTETM